MGKNKNNKKQDKKSQNNNQVDVVMISDWMEEWQRIRALLLILFFVSLMSFMYSIHELRTAIFYADYTPTTENINRVENVQHHCQHDFILALILGLISYGPVRFFRSRNPNNNARVPMTTLQDDVIL